MNNALLAGAVRDASGRIAMRAHPLLPGVVWAPEGLAVQILRHNADLRDRLWSEMRSQFRGDSDG